MDGIAIAKEIIVTVSALTGAVLGVVNYRKTAIKDKQEARVKASQNLVKAQYRQGWNASKREMRDLYIVNTDTRPVRDVDVSFFADLEKASEVVSKQFHSLKAEAEEPVKQFKLDKPCPRCAEFKYTDADGKPHDYTQAEIET